MGYGKVYIVGAGPGDPKLLTLKALEVLQEADVIFYDRLVNPEILKFAKPEADKIYVGKTRGKHSVPQNKINELMVKAALDGKTVVRLKGGDPFLFGRGGEEAETLAEKGIAYEVVPGVTSAIAAPAYAGIPLTHRDYASSLAIVTGSQAEDAGKPIRWEKLAKAVDTIVILMGLKPLGEIAESLMKSGLSPEMPAAVIEWGTLERQRVVIGKLSNIADEVKAKGIEPPSVIVIGKV
ncbi:uroporphyrinogen-III C-methyltransferase, partial [Candidatus Bathyarchaeota archaeon]|nr:uroporphyrinogen-III C-methyltransferase [Candidatus Bathyarchaeota archaeon]